MGYIALGVVGFVIAGFFDLAALRGWGHLKQVIGLAILSLWGYVFFSLMRVSPRFRLSAPLIWLGWLLLIIAALLLIYSLFIEISFRQTYAKDGVGDTLVTTGTYALCRHPGVLWFGLLLIALILVSHARLLLIAAPVWFLMDVLWVWVQDVYFFPRMFSGYRQYQQKTPMLIPTLNSMRRFWRTLQGSYAISTPNMGKEHHDHWDCQDQ